MPDLKKNIIETAHMDESDNFRTEGEDLWFGHEAIAEDLVKNGNTPPGSIKHQNLGHNSKKVGLGPNTKR